MIKSIKVGDITSPDNPAHIIIGMNSQLDDVTGIGRSFVNKIRTAHPIKLGSVLSFKFDEARNLHMLICHHLGRDGWVGSDMHVRYGMDYLWQTEKHTEAFSIVAIGTGRVGVRDGADDIAIRTAMTNSHLSADLFIYQKPEEVARHLKRSPDTMRFWCHCRRIATFIRPTVKKSSSPEPSRHSSGKATWRTAFLYTNISSLLTNSGKKQYLLSIILVLTSRIPVH